MTEKKTSEKDKIIEQLRRIRWVDKYHTFHKIVPGVDKAGEDEKETITNIVEDCCTELIRHYNAKRKPTKEKVKKIILKYMDMISYTEVNTESKDFGYELCWYIGEKIGVDIRKYTETKVYGYWRVEENALRTVKKRGKRPDK